MPCRWMTWATSKPARRISRMRLSLSLKLVAVVALLIVDVREDPVPSALADVERLAVARVDEPVDVGLELCHHIWREGFSASHRAITVSAAADHPPAGCPVGCPDMNRTPVGQAAARSLPKFGSAAGPRKGVPVSPLRFDPGTPFLDQHITDVYGEARCRAWGGSERAAAGRRANAGISGCRFRGSRGQAGGGRTKGGSRAGMWSLDQTEGTQLVEAGEASGRTNRRPTEV